MKFISGIKKEDGNVNIKIPIYHRTSISFFDGSEVYYIYRTYALHEFSIRELILTPIKPSIWQHIRKVTINAIDSPGIIFRITSVLKELKINVNIEEALTTQIGAIHTITLIIDLSTYIQFHPKFNNMGKKVPQEAIDEIVLRLKDLKNQNDNPIVNDGQVYIKELTFLESISDLPENYSISNIDIAQFTNCSNQKIKIKNGEIHLEKRIVNALRLNEEPFFYTMFSDTEEKYIKILFFDTNQKVAFIDIFHEDVFGAIAKFTGLIHNNYSFNVLASYSHQQMQKDTAHWFGLIDISNNERQFFNETLDALKTAKYGEYERKSVLGVFLIETNTTNLSEDTILRFGQNRKTKDGEITSIYLKKKEVIKKKLDEFTLTAYKKSHNGFIRNYGLHNTTSIHKLIASIINERKSTKKIKYKKITIWLISIIFPLVPVWIAMIYSESFKEKILAIFQDSVLLGVLVLCSTVTILSHKYLSKISEDF